jgi:hypothetical protein
MTFHDAHGRITRAHAARRARFALAGIADVNENAPVTKKVHVALRNKDYASWVDGDE